MKRLLALVFGLFLLILPSCVKAEEFTIRNGVKFGMSPEEIIRIEQANGYQYDETNDGSTLYKTFNNYQLYYQADAGSFGRLPIRRFEYDFDPTNQMMYQLYYVFDDEQAFDYLTDALTEEYGPSDDSVALETEKYAEIGNKNHISHNRWAISLDEQTVVIDLWNNSYDVTLLSYQSFSENQKRTVAYDFKTFYWGATKDEVIAKEGKPYTKGKVTGLDAEYIAYETTAVGLDMLLAYYFCDDGLFQVRYILMESHSNESLYIDDYEKFRSALTKKYGDPLLDYEDWESDEKKEYYADRKGDALSYGYLTYTTWYMTGRTWISMDMSADNYEITMRVDYESRTINPGEADYSDEI